MAFSIVPREEDSGIVDKGNEVHEFLTSGRGRITLEQAETLYDAGAPG
jgi:hypothetical protein